MAELAELDVEEIEELEDLVEQVSYDSDEIPPEAYNDFPDDYVIAICSLRGTGKSALLAYYLLNGLAAGEHIFTNLPLFPERAGIYQTPNPLLLDQLLSFDPALDKAVIGIEELHTWIQKKRPMATSAIMADEFLRQLRKRVIRVIFTDQSTNLPRDIERDVDLFIQGTDMRWTDYGRENNIPKGTTFLYQATDFSARFTGQRLRQWKFSLTLANRLWDKFDSFKIYDPFQAFRKYKIIGGGMEYDIDSGKMYGAGEREAQISEEVLQRRFLLLTKFWRSFEVNLLEIAVKSNAIVEDYPNMLALSVEKLRTAVSQLRGNKRRAAEREYNDLRLLANGGEMAIYRSGRKVIELAKPIMIEADDSALGQTSNISAETKDAIKDLATTGFKGHQIANKLKISEQAVNETLEGVCDE